MALNLSDLTGSSTSGDILAEVQSTADFLDSVPLLKNLADPSGATDAKQFTATKQPIALPLIDNEGYLFLSDVAGNYASTPDDSSLDITGDITLECDFALGQNFPSSGEFTLVAKYNSINNQRAYLLKILANGIIRLVLSPNGQGSGSSVVAEADFSSVISAKTKASVKVTWRQSDGLTQFFIKQNDGSWLQIGSDSTLSISSIFNSSQPVEIGADSGGVNNFNGSVAIFGARIYASVDGTDKRLDVDFTSPRIPHGATEFTCETGQVVTVNQNSSSSSNIATIIKKPVLRFDGVNAGLHGIFSLAHTGGHVFAAFTGLSTGGDRWGRVFTTNPTGYGDNTDGFSYIAHEGNTANIGVEGSDSPHYYDGLWAREQNVLVEVKAENGLQESRVNNANIQTSSGNIISTSSDEFNIGENEGDETRNDGENAPFDLEYLAVFPTSISADQASQIRNWLNNRNSVYLRHRTDGYYFYDAAATVLNQDFVSSGAGSWNGRIVGSDFGDADNPIGNGTQTDRPTTDGYKVTFADNTDHFDFSPKTQAGWQIVGTSLGTFAYKVSGSSITTFNLLGNETSGSYYYRKLGDLYGIILLPESATARDIEEARKLLIDRGAGDGATTTGYGNAWNARYDITEFKNTEFSGVTNLSYAWASCVYMTAIGAINAPNCSNFYAAWDGAALTQFPSGSKLGTEVSVSQGVNFSYAWRGTSLTSFPALDLSTGKWFNSAWRNTELTSFPKDIKLDNGLDFNYAWRECVHLEEFHTPLPEATTCRFAWYICGNLKNFSSSLPKVTNMYQAFLYSYNLETFEVDEMPELQDARYTWRDTNLSSFNTKLNKVNACIDAWKGCDLLVDFSADVFANWNPSSISEYIFKGAWDGCTSLTVQSVENILVPIANSGKWATNTGASGGNQLTDPEITIDYDVTTGSLTAATLSAIETLNGRGWSVNINNEIIVPNILQLQPAAAYSLRSFDSDADPTVVNVRRSSDGSLSDFTASQVSDGTLRDWTLGDTEIISHADSGDRMYFDGLNDRIQFEGTDISIPSKSEVTIRTRFMWTDGLGPIETIFGNYKTGNDSFHLTINASGIGFIFGDNVSTADVTSPIETHKYYDVTATVKVDGSNATVNLFVDGVAIGEDSFSSSVTDFSANSNNIWNIGYLNSARYFAGIIDYVEVYEGYSTDGSVTGMTALHKWTNTNTTNASWVDQVGDADGTVYGSPALFSGQGFDGYVTTWYDQSANGNNSTASLSSVDNWTQDVASTQPLIVENGALVTENGEAAIKFDGVDDELGLDNGQLLNSTDPRTYSALFTTNDDKALIIGGQNVGYNDQYGNAIYVNLSEIRAKALYNSTGVFMQSGVTVSGSHLVTARMKSGDSSLYVNGVEEATSTENLQTYESYANRIGGGHYANDNLNGTIQEIVIFDTDQSANRAAIEKNINDHYSIY